MMPKTALLWLAAYGAGLLLSLVDPFYALLAYLLDYYAHPPLRWWGDSLPDLRWSLLAALVLLASYTVHGRSLFDRSIVGHSQTLWLLALLAAAILVTPFAVDPARNLEELITLAKLTLLYMLIVGTVRTRSQFRWVVIVMIAGALLWGVDAYLHPERTAGRLRGVGGPDSDADNSTAAHLLTVLPFIGVYLWKGRPAERLLAFVAMPFVLNAVILCNSRGASVAMVAMAGATLFLTHGRQRMLLAGAVASGGVLFAVLLDHTFVDRQLALFGSELDTSAAGRLETWKGALRLMRDRPFGAGGGGWDALSPVYIPDIVAAFDGQARAVHNTFLLVGTDWGVLGLVLFLAFVVATLRQLHAIRRVSADDRATLESLALEVGLVGFLVAAFFINRAYAEVLYWFAALSAALANCQHEREPVPAESVRVGERATRSAASTAS